MVEQDISQILSGILSCIRLNADGITRVCRFDPGPYAVRHGNFI